jgi:hypothetical protein
VASDWAQGLLAAYGYPPTAHTTAAQEARVRGLQANGEVFQFDRLSSPANAFDYAISSARAAKAKCPHAVQAYQAAALRIAHLASTGNTELLEAKAAVERANAVCRSAPVARAGFNPLLLFGGLGLLLLLFAKKR